MNELCALNTLTYVNIERRSFPNTLFDTCDRTTAAVEMVELSVANPVPPDRGQAAASQSLYLVTLHTTAIAVCDFQSPQTSWVLLFNCSLPRCLLKSNKVMRKLHCLHTAAAGG